MTPNVPLRFEHTVDLPADPEQVWQAIATAWGITSWFLPTDLEEREGGTIVTHMGETDSPGTVTGWEPHRRFAYEEPEWANFSGHEGAEVTPLATEFLIEARSGGTCTLRVVSSAFGTGADWEEEFFADMERGWLPFFERLRLYLADFPGQRAAPLFVDTVLPGEPAAVLQAMRQDLGIGGVGDPVSARGVTARVERAGADDVLLRVSEPVPGFLGFVTVGGGEGSTIAFVQGHLFSEDAAGFVERERPRWKAWLERLALPTP